MLTLPERLFEVLGMVAPGHLFHISVTKPGTGAVDAFLSLPAHRELTALASLQDQVQRMPGVRDCSFYLQAEQRPTSFHDLMDLATLESTVLWQVFCEPLDLHYDLSINFHRSAQFFYTLSTSRDNAPYSEEERQLLRLLQPHLQQRFRMLLAAEPRHPLGRQALKETPVDYLICDSDGFVETLSQGAQSLLASGGYSLRSRLDQEWRAWLSQNLREIALLSPPRPLELPHPAGRLLVFCLRNNHSGQHRLILELQDQQGPPLTPREKEVARWIAEGKSNAEIGNILGISRATVKVHVERILAKLGVENRTTAALLIAKLRTS